MIPARRINQTWLPSIFNDMFDTDFMARTNATAPAINVLEKENSYELELAAPGLTKEDFNVTLDKDGDLVIKMEKKQSNEEKSQGHYLRREFSYTKFQQTMLLPENADRDNIKAQVNNGVLSVSIPKMSKSPEAELEKQIEIL